ncbi:hypothetical protein OBBRIDRAFT_805891 [Obba rivulosa]|uniref:Uncharacterized protein n=1 Tax=Obba rivulosa TaxID=1052685 RepID=A0A8E2AMZ5_9APHY|nr:hypothetical protein OBBRIDRAFT_805891 [Obba rivulosa]
MSREPVSCGRSSVQNLGSEPEPPDRTVGSVQVQGRSRQQAAWFGPRFRGRREVLNLVRTRSEPEPVAAGTRCGNGAWFAGSDLTAPNNTDASCSVVCGCAPSPPPHACPPTFCPPPVTMPTPPRCPPVHTTPIAPAASPAPTVPNAGVNSNTVMTPASPGVCAGQPMHLQACCCGAQLLARATICISNGCASTPVCPSRAPPPSAHAGACPRCSPTIHLPFARLPSAHQAFPGRSGVFPHVEPAPTCLAARPLARLCTCLHAPWRVPEHTSYSFSP